MDHVRPKTNFYKKIFMTFVKQGVLGHDSESTIHKRKKQTGLRRNLKVSVF